MTTYAAVIEAAIPGVDDDTREHILWGRTPFPMGRVTARSLFKAASGWRRATSHNLRLCDHCDRPAEIDKWECSRCRSALERASAA